MQSRFSSLLLVVVTYVFFPGQAYAYIDMNTGSIVFQILAGGLIGAIFTIKAYWLSLKLKVRTLYLKMTGHAKAADSESINNADSER
jgi:hypothetical protein